MEHHYDTLFSKPRLSNYLNFNEYVNNIIYSQSHYAKLHLIEVSLRNKINNTLINKLGQNWLKVDNSGGNFLYEDTINVLNTQIYQFKKHKSDINHDDIVSSLSFGFWVSLFSRRYYKKYSTTEIKMIFNLPRKNVVNEKKLLQISKDLAVIKNFRNRVFHYEKVNNHKQYIHIEQLLDKYLKLIDVENILSSTIRDITTSLEHRCQ